MGQFDNLRLGWPLANSRGTILKFNSSLLCFIFVFKLCFLMNAGAFLFITLFPDQAEKILQMNPQDSSWIMLSQNQYLEACKAIPDLTRRILCSGLNFSIFCFCYWIFPGFIYLNVLCFNWIKMMKCKNAVFWFVRFFSAGKLNSSGLH